MSIVALPCLRFANAARWNGHAPQITTGVLHAHNTLTVSDADDFGKRGGMVRFVVEDRRVRLRINVEAARAAGLTISSNLLRIAEIATTDPS